MNSPADWEHKLTPRLRLDLRIRAAGDPQRQGSILEDRVSGKCYELGAREAAGLLACDGEQSLETARLATAGPSASEPFTAAEFHLLLTWASAKQMFVDHSDAAIERLQSAWQVARRGAWFRWTNPICLTISWGSPERWLRRLSPHLQWLFAPQGIPLAILVVAYAIFCLWAHAERFSHQVIATWADGNWWPLLVVWLAIKVGHELAHGVVSHRYQSSVRDCGVFLVLFFPLAFVDISSSSKLSGRWQRIHIAAAGMYFEMVLAAMATIVWAWSENVSLSAWMHAIILSAGISTLLFNANPLMKFDGYYILADLVGIPNLAQRGRWWLSRAVQKWCLGVPTQSLPLPWAKRVVVACYGLAALVWRILLQITLTIAAAALFHGLGVLLAVLASLHYVVEPICRLFLSFPTQTSWKDWRLANVATTVGVLGLLAWLLTATLTGPAYLSVPAVVRYPAERYVRAGAAGFVAQIAVADGQFVRAGDLLIQLHRPELSLQVDTLKIQIEQTRQQANVARQDARWIEYHNANRQISGLELQLAERTEELAGLALRAPADGIIRQPALPELMGQYFQRGTALLTLDDGRKELAVSISQDDFATLSMQAQAELRLIFAGLPLSYGRLQALSPAASDAAPAAALTRPHGGPLWVQPASQTKRPARFLQPDSATADLMAEVKLLTPHVTGIVAIPRNVAAQLPIGTTGTVFIPRQRQSLASYLVVKVRRWFGQQLDRVRQA